MDNDTRNGLLGCGVAVWGTIFLVIVLIVGSYSFWYVDLRSNTAIQPVRRQNINAQAENVRALNAGFHHTLADIRTDSTTINSFKQQLKDYEVLHNPKKLDCNSVADYNDCQTIQNLETNITSAETDRTSLINTYNSDLANSDNNSVAIDSNLPHHIDPNNPNP